MPPTPLPDGPPTASRLARPEDQVRFLESSRSVPPFDGRLERDGLSPLRATSIDILQINVGKLCNQACRHCHVDAGPDRREIMSRDTMELCLEALDRCGAPVVDITGGAPELNPDFRWLVRECRRRGRRVLDRCNLSVLMLDGQEDLARFLAEQRVEVIASLPYYLRQETDAQRGNGVFELSVRALRRLNDLGYGRPGSGLRLDLVYNPVGAYLPPAQHAIESDYRRELRRRHGLTFSNLYTITNMPISRFLEFLVRSGNYDEYMHRLAESFNPAAVAGLMCRDTLSIGWDGRLYDCDFNQMLELTVNHGSRPHVRDLDPAALSRRRVVTGRHCYGCTAGAGSSCSGATAP